MTPDEYKKRIEALGLSQSDWYNLVGISRSGHFRHLQGQRDIPQTLINILHWLEDGYLVIPKN